MTPEPQSAATPDRVGPYRISGVLGRGGMGVVYQAEHLDTGERVALKTVSDVDHAILASIRREIHALRRIDHPGVVRIVAEGLEGGVPWYAMDLLDGFTLRDFLASPGRRPSAPTCTPTADLGAASTVALEDSDPAYDHTVPSGDLSRPSGELSPPAADGSTASTGGPRTASPASATLHSTLGMFRGVCDTLAYVHGKGIVHRDLKPENVFIREGGAPVLFDFGLAQATSGAVGRDVLEVGGRPAGSPAYMAPEQIVGRPVDARCDLYALGIMLYECVTGRVPFSGPVTQVLQQHVMVAPEPPSALVDEVPPELESLILQLLEKQPHDRPGYADDVAAGLEALGAVGVSADAADAPRCRPYLYRPSLAGRATLLARVADSVGRGQDAGGAAIFVCGESGIGKTRFALEVAAIALSRGLRVITGECAAVSAGHGDDGVRGAPLHAFRPLLQAIADRCRERGAAETTRLLGERGPVLATCEPSIARLPGQEALPALPVLSPQAAGARLASALAATLGAFSTAEPVLLLVDDLQWADESSLAALRALDAEWLARHRVVVVGTYRSDEASDELRALGGAPGALSVELGRLDADAVAHMVGDMLAMRAPPARFVEFLVEQSEGNPFFIAEYLRAAIDEGVLDRDEAGVWRVAAEGTDGAAYRTTIPLPGELRALVLRRLSSLSPAAHAVARVAAVLGREFAADVLAAATSLDDISGFEAVEELRVRQILEVAGSRLRFAHDKLRETIATHIPAAELRRLSLAAARAIEARHAGTPEIAEHYPVLAHHFSAAGLFDEALDYLEKAGERALDGGASSDAIGFFRRAVELDDERRRSAAAPVPALRRACWERRLGQAEYNLGHFAASERLTSCALHRLRTGRQRTRPVSTLVVFLSVLARLVWQTARLLWPARRPATDPQRRRRLTEASLAAERLGEIYYFEGKPLRSFGVALLAVRLAEGLGPSPELARGYGTLGVAFGLVPLARASAAFESRARVAAAATRDPQAIAWVEFVTALSAIGNARWAIARGATARAIEGYGAVQDLRRREECLALASDVEFMTGRYDEAMRLTDELHASARRSGNRQAEFWAVSTRAWVLTSLGRPDEALEHWTRLPALMAGGAGDQSQHITLGEGARTHLLLGDRATARRLAEETLVHMQRMTPSAFHLIWGYEVTCEVLLMLAKDEAKTEERALLLRGARAAHREIQRYARIFPVGRPALHRFAALFHTLAGRRGRAEHAFSRSLAEAERLDMPIEAAQARFELGRYLPASDPRRAEQLSLARGAFARHGALHGLGCTETALAASPSPTPRSTDP